MPVQSESLRKTDVDRCHLQVDNQLFSDFKAWKEEPTLDRSCCFLERVYREDIYPCLSFSKSEVRDEEHTSSLNTPYSSNPPKSSQFADGDPWWLIVVLHFSETSSLSENESCGFG